jgi:hypothetical protein
MEVPFGGSLCCVFWELKLIALCFNYYYCWFFCFGLQEMDEAENKLRAGLENMHLRTSVDAGQSWTAESSEEENKMNRASFDAAAEVSKSAMLDKLEEKKKELVCCFFNRTILFCILNHNVPLNIE